MRRNRILAIILALVTFLSVGVLSACKKDEEEQEVLSQRMQNFVYAVASIQTPITLSSGADIDFAYDAYAFLDEYERSSKTVSASKQTLDGYQSQYTALKNANSNEPVDEQVLLAESFLSQVNALPALDELVIGDRSAINSALTTYNKLDAQWKKDSDVVSAYKKLKLADSRVAELEEIALHEQWLKIADQFIKKVYYGIGDVTEDTIYNLDDMLYLEDLIFEYNELSDWIKNVGGMNEAKALLDKKYADYLVLRDEHDIEEFVSAVRNLGKNSITLNSASAILEAENIYRLLSENAKQNSSVVSSYKKLCQFREQYDVLFAIAEQERIDYFIQLVDDMPTDLDSMNMEWFFILDKISDAYYALSYESTSKPEVVDAYNRWNAVLKEFNKLGYKQIPMVDPILVYSGDSPSHIVLQYEDRMLNKLMEFYNVSTMAKLAEQATAYLNVYVDGVYVASGRLNTAELGHIIMNTEVVSILKQLATSNPQIVSGANFQFSIHIEDNSERYVRSYETNLSATKNNYTW